MTYRETIDYLYSQLPVFHRIGKPAYKANLDNTRALDDYFGNPHKKYRTIHVAGTNGKGSVSHMLASVFHEAGYRTGLYTSPHLRDYRERIRIGPEMIPESVVTEFVERNRDLLESMRPSFFEMTVALAFSYFADENIDVAVVETGLGGRLDSTNIITPLLSVITNIGFDHMDLLGDTLELIAAEKAGIIKSNVPVLIGEATESTAGVFISRASGQNAEILFASDLYSCRMLEYDYFSEYREFQLKNSLGEILFGSSPLPGDYQANNIPVVAAAVDILQQNFMMTRENLLDGIKNTRKNTGLMGRWQVLRTNPLVICDTGHNEDGIRSVVSQLSAVRKHKLHMVIGLVADKDSSRILSHLPADALYYFTRASVPRALDEEVLRKRAEAFGLTGRSYPSVKEAFETALSAASAGDVVFVGGSTFVVAEVV